MLIPPSMWLTVCKVNGSTCFWQSLCLDCRVQVFAVSWLFGDCLLVVFPSWRNVAPDWGHHQCLQGAVSPLSIPFLAPDSIPPRSLVYACPSSPMNGRISVSVWPSKIFNVIRGEGFPCAILLPYSPSLVSATHSWTTRELLPNLWVSRVNLPVFFHQASDESEALESG